MADVRYYQHAALSGALADTDRIPMDDDMGSGSFTTKHCTPLQIRTYCLATLGTAASLNVPASGDAAANEVVKGNDSRLTNARTPTAHVHAASDITTGTLAIARGGTGIGTAPSDGKLLIGKTDGSYAVANISAGSNITITNGDGTIQISSAVGNHNLLSSTHSDTTAASVARGDLITGQGVSPTWSRLAKGASGTYLRSDGTDVGYSAILAGDLPSAQNIAKLTNLTSNGFVKTSSGDGTLSIDTNTYLTSSTGVSSIAGTANQVNASGSTGAVTLSLPQSIATGSTPQFAALGLGQAAPTAGISITGRTLNTDADGTVGASSTTFTVTKNDANNRTFAGVQIKPTLNAGASNAATTLDVLQVDTVNTSTTGMTVNLMDLMYGGTSFFAVNSAGNVSGGTYNKVTITAPASSATLTIANGKTLTVSNSLTLAGTDATTMTFPTTSATVARTDAGQTFTGTQTFLAGSTSTKAAVFQAASGAANSNINFAINDGSGTQVFRVNTGGDTIIGGTGAPLKRLDVALGEIIISSAPSGGGLTIQGASPSNTIRNIWNESGTAVASFDWDSAGNFLKIRAIKANAATIITSNNTDRLFIDSSGNFGFGTNTYGTSAAKVLSITNTGTAPTSQPADIAQWWSSDFAAGDARFRLLSESGSRITIGNDQIGFATGTTDDLFVGRRAAANFRHGAPDAASPVAQTISVQSVVAGTSNTAGVNWTRDASAGTGTGAGGSHIWRVAPAGSTGTSQNAFVTSMTLDSTHTMTLADGFNFALNTTTGTKIGTATSQKLSLWNQTPIVQPAGANQAAITDSTGGTAGFTLVDVTTAAVADPAKINNNFASLARLVDNIRTAMVNFGSMKGAA